MKRFFIALGAVTLWAACTNTKNNASDYDKIFNDPITYCKSVYELNSVVMGNNFSPIVASRNYLYANVAAYEVIAAGYPGQYESLGKQLKGLGELPKPTA